MKIDYSSTSSQSNGTTLTIDTLRRAVELIGKTKRIKILFSPFVNDKVLCGEWIDRILQCNEYEEGFIVPESFREHLGEFRDVYQEIIPHDLVPRFGDFNDKP